MFLRSCLFAVSILLSINFIGCSGGGGSPTGTEGSSSVVVQELEFYRDPFISRDPVDEKTTITVEFVARRSDNSPLDADQLSISMLLNNQPIDNEALLDSTSVELETFLHLWPTLDASYSMQLHNPPAFESALHEARRTVDAGIEMYENQSGNFDWDFLWFSDFLNTPFYTWTTSTIEDIPAPTSGEATKLYSAIRYQAEESLGVWQNNGSRDNERHVIVVLSDGGDNYSWHDNPGHYVVQQFSYHNFVERGFASTDTSGVMTAIRNHPNLQVHVVGMGDAIEPDILRNIAQTGNGSFYHGAGPDDLERMFSSIISEFTTIQVRGVRAPLQPGEYTFSLNVRDEGTETGGVVKEFRFRTDASGTEFLGFLD